MKLPSSAFLVLPVLSGALPSNSSIWKVKPFKIDLSKPAQRMRSLVASYRLPSQPVYQGSGFSHGTNLDWLKKMQKTWAENFDWSVTQAHMNRFSHYKVNIENTSLHFIHYPSRNASAIPLILSHGWPGSFYEFDRVIEPLANPPPGEQAFHVVVPSLPGFGFSSLPPSSTWTIGDTVRILTTLMKDVLGYETFGAEGGDWGAGITWGLLNEHPNLVKAALFTNLPRLGYTLEQYNATWPNETASFSAEDLDGISRLEAWSTTGFGYFQELTTRPSTVGLALYDSPMGQLSWIGQLMHDWTDPNPNTTTFSNYTILEEVSLYYLTNTVESSSFIYAQNSGAFATQPEAVNTPVGISEYKYDILHLPRFLMNRLANVTYHVRHERGGHFPALENPEALVGDLRAFFSKNWVQ